MTSAPVRDPLADHLLTPENSAFLIIDYQPSQVAGVHSMDRALLVENAVSTVWKDRFLCFWFYTPRTGEGYIHGYPIDWEEAHLLVRIDPNWDYDRQKMITPEFQDQIDDNLERQFRHGERIFDFFKKCRLKYPVSLHFIAQRATDSQFYVRRIEAQRCNPNDETRMTNQ